MRRPYRREGRRRAEGAAHCEDARGLGVGCCMSVVVHVLNCECKKVHFYCIFLQENLHISKKSSIFASGLGIVPAVTLKYLEFMKERCIFRACGGKKMCRVVVRYDSANNPFFVVYHGRKLAPFVSKWCTLVDAVRYAKRIAVRDMFDLNNDFRKS